LKSESCQEQLAQQQAKHNDEPCDKKWWAAYSHNLLDFKELRNACCHSGYFGWDKVEELIDILFTNGVFLKTIVGKSL
jgi:hypothetical protein